MSRFRFTVLKEIEFLFCLNINADMNKFWYERKYIKSSIISKQNLILVAFKQKKKF